MSPVKYRPYLRKAFSIDVFFSPREMGRYLIYFISSQTIQADWVSDAAKKKWEKNIYILLTMRGNDIQY